MEGVTVLGFPCNQFGLQEPGSNAEILKVLEHVRPGDGYRPNFPLFNKIEVNGETEDEFFTFMKSKCDLVAPTFTTRSQLYYDPMRPTDIEWNFHKFLIDHEGRLYRRYNHNVSPEDPTLLNDVRVLQKRRSKALEIAATAATTTE